MASSELKAPPKVPPLNTIILGIRASTYAFSGDTNIHFITPGWACHEVFHNEPELQ